MQEACALKTVPKLIFRELRLSGAFQLLAGQAVRASRGQLAHLEPSCSHQLPPCPAGWRPVLIDLITVGRSLPGSLCFSFFRGAGMEGGQADMQASIWRGKGGDAFLWEERHMAHSQPKWTSRECPQHFTRERRRHQRHM